MNQEPLSSHEETRTATQARKCPDHLNVSGVPVDVISTPLGDRIGSKRPASIDLKAGGNGANGGQVAVANGISCGVFGLQGAGMLADISRNLLLRAGLTPFVVGRAEIRGAISVAVPNGKPGTFDLDVQRMEPISAGEFRAFAETLSTRPLSLFMGPMQVASAALDLHVEVARLARHRSLMVHPSLLRNADLFREVGRLYELVQMSYAEARLLDPSTNDIRKLACRVRYLLGEGTDFAITNGSREGLLWADRKWIQVRPNRIRASKRRTDVGAGDVWGAAICLSQWYFGASVEQAASYAERAAAAWITGAAIPAF